MDNSRTKPDLIPETSVPEERDEERNWRSVVIMGLERKIDLKVIEPYKKVTLLSCFFFCFVFSTTVLGSINQLLVAGTFTRWLPRQRLPDGRYCV